MVRKSTVPNRHVQEILAAAQRGSALVDHVLSFSRKKPVAAKSVKFPDLMASSHQLIVRALGQGIKLKTVCPPDTWPIRVDTAQAESALLNMALNAKHAMRREGSVEVRCCNETFTDGEIEDAPTMAGDFVCICVQDDGSGMSEDILQRVVEPFFTTKAVGKDSGLGLSMVHGFVTQAGGHLGISSTLGEGTTLSLYFPRDMSSLGFKMPADVPQVLQTRRASSILVVEGEPSVSELLRDMLGELGYAAVLANDAATSESHVVPGDELCAPMCDVTLPCGKNGVDLVTSLCARHPHLPFLFTSGSSPGSTRQLQSLDAQAVVLQIHSILMSWPPPSMRSFLSAPQVRYSGCS